MILLLRYLSEEEGAHINQFPHYTIHKVSKFSFTIVSSTLECRARTFSLCILVLVSHGHFAVRFAFRVELSVVFVKNCFYLSCCKDIFGGETTNDFIFQHILLLLILNDSFDYRAEMKNWRATVPETFNYRFITCHLDVTAYKVLFIPVQKLFFLQYMTSSASRMHFNLVHFNCPIGSQKFRSQRTIVSNSESSLTVIKKYRFFRQYNRFPEYTY